MRDYSPRIRILREALGFGAVMFGFSIAGQLAGLFGPVNEIEGSIQSIGVLLIADGLVLGLLYLTRGAPAEFTKQVPWRSVLATSFAAGSASLLAGAAARPMLLNGPWWWVMSTACVLIVVLLATLPESKERTAPHG